MTYGDLGVALGVITLVGTLAYSQIRGTLDLADGFKDEAGRTSAGRICAVGAWLASTSYLLTHEVSDTLFLGYCSLWALLLFGNKGLDLIGKIADLKIGKSGEKALS